MRPFFHSVRFRLACWYGLVQAVVLVVFWLLLYGTARYQGLHHHDESLREAANTVISILERQPDCATLTPDQVTDLRRLNRLVLIHELGAKGEVFYRSPDLDPALLPPPESEFRDLLARKESFETLQHESDALRVYSVAYTSHAGRRGVVRVVDSLGNVPEFLATLRRTLFLVVPFSLLFLSFAGYWLAGRALRPVDELTRLAQQIGATNLSRRLPIPRTKDELGRLVDTFNQMIGRLESSFEAMRRFTSDASHELRTPLTIMRNALDVALGRERTPESYRTVLTDLLDEVHRMSRMVEGLLFLAGAEAGNLDFERRPLRADLLAADVVETMKPLAEAESIVLSSEDTGPTELVGDEKWLRQMLYNLVDNAIKHGGAAGRIVVSTASRGGWVEVRVRDTGPGIAPEEHPHLFERFYRVDRSRGRGTGGTGLGLATALWIAKSHGGDIKVESELGRGATFCIVLPAGAHQ